MNVRNGRNSAFLTVLSELSIASQFSRLLLLVQQKLKPQFRTWALGMSATMSIGRKSKAFLTAMNAVENAVGTSTDARTVNWNFAMLVGPFGCDVIFAVMYGCEVPFL